MSCRLETAAVGDDPALEEKYKLPILTKGDLFTSIDYAGAWAYSTFAHMSPGARKTLTSGAMACVLYGLCGFVEQEQDGDWREEATAKSEFTQLPPKDTYSSESLRTALDIIIATKANWWTKNRHTGPGIMIRHAKKCSHKDFAQTTHILGHWASTINVLSVAGVKGLRIFTSLSLPGEKKLTLSGDAEFIFSLLPAGTRKLAMAYAAAVKLLESPFAGICSSVEYLRVIPEIYTRIKETPASYHIEAQYLTGKPRADYDDLQNKGYLGMLGAYFNITINMPQEYTNYASKLANALASYRKDDANPKEALRKFLRRIDEAIQELQDALGVLSTADNDDEAGEALLKQIGRIDKAVQDLQDSLGVSSAAGKSKEKGDEAVEALRKQIERIDEAVQELQDALEVSSAAGKSNGKGNEGGEALENVYESKEEEDPKIQDAFRVPSAPGNSKRRRL